MLDSAVLLKSIQCLDYLSQKKGVKSQNLIPSDNEITTFLEPFYKAAIASNDKSYLEILTHVMQRLKTGQIPINFVKDFLKKLTLWAKLFNLLEATGKLDISLMLTIIYTPNSVSHLTVLSDVLQMNNSYSEKKSLELVNVLTKLIKFLEIEDNDSEENISTLVNFLLEEDEALFIADRLINNFFKVTAFKTFFKTISAILKYIEQTPALPNINLLMRGMQGADPDEQLLLISSSLNVKKFTLSAASKECLELAKIAHLEYLTVSDLFYRLLILEDFDIVAVKELVESCIKIVSLNIDEIFYTPILIDALTKGPAHTAKALLKVLEFRNSFSVTPKSGVTESFLMHMLFLPQDIDNYDDLITKLKLFLYSGKINKEAIAGALQFHDQLGTANFAWAINFLFKNIKNLTSFSEVIFFLEIKYWKVIQFFHQKDENVEALTMAFYTLSQSFKKQTALSKTVEIWIDNIYAQFDLNITLEFVNNLTQLIQFNQLTQPVVIQLIEFCDSHNILVFAQALAILALTKTNAERWIELLKKYDNQNLAFVIEAIKKGIENQISPDRILSLGEISDTLQELQTRLLTIIIIQSSVESEQTTGMAFKHIF